MLTARSTAGSATWRLVGRARPVAALALQPAAARGTYWLRLWTTRLLLPVPEGGVRPWQAGWCTPRWMLCTTPASCGTCRAARSNQGSHLTSRAWRIRRRSSAMSTKWPPGMRPLAVSADSAAAMTSASAAAAAAALSSAAWPSLGELSSAPAGTKHQACASTLSQALALQPPPPSCIWPHPER